ncbi:hypothetical protein [Stenotrophomonas cyclobalanopsidis]|uniref:hypothetical protein n=1 Tax=Stenotrophomonas cyclobalanopsidis TaxID=2771362 RepID=UPI0028AE991A|nr:hypothetical protein [Stenotrophomonas cyclobalanopsidis]
MTMYFADNKDVRDLLETSKQKLTPEVLREFLLRRGIIVSNEATKAELFDQISMWTLDLEDLNWLLERTARSDRNERFTSATVTGSFSPEEVQKALETLKISPIGDMLDSLTYSKTAGGPFLVEASYSELDPAKTRLRQKRTRDGSIRLEMNPQGVSIRYEANEKMSSVAEELMRMMIAGKDDATEARKIDLSHLTSIEVRTRFFLALIENVGGMKLSDVSKVKVERSVPPTNAEGTGDHDDDDGDAGDLNEDEEELEEGDQDKPDLELVGNQVRGAILRGVSLLTSKEFQMLRENFFLYGMEWTSEENAAKGKIVQFEAAFEDAQSCTGFRYKVKGIIDRKKSGGGADFVKSARPCTELEHSYYMRLLEEASAGALAEVDPAPASAEGDGDDASASATAANNCAGSSKITEVLDTEDEELDEVDQDE